MREREPRHLLLHLALPRRLVLRELEEDSYRDPGLVALAHKVDYEIDPEPGFPKFRSGEVIVKTRAGAMHRRREQIVPDEPASEGAIVSKFMDNVGPVAGAERAGRIRDTVLNLDALDDTRSLAALLS